jgi:hypothetical protein
MTGVVDAWRSWLRGRRVVNPPAAAYGDKREEKAAIARAYVDPSSSFFSSIGFTALPSVSNSTIEPARIYAAALAPFQTLSEGERNEFIDSQILSMMLSAEQILTRCGDIQDGIAAKIDLSSSGIIISHPDDGVRDQYQEFADLIGMNELLDDSWLCEEIYGQGYVAFANDGDRPLVFPFNPMRIAVGSQYSIGRRPIIFVVDEGAQDRVRSEFYKQNIATQTWNEWPEFGDELGTSLLGTSTAILLDPSRIYHRHGLKPMFKRYAIPPAIKAWDALTDRIVLGEMIRSTMEGIKTQIRLWTLKDPRPNELTTIKSEITGMRTDRVYDFVFREGLTATQIVPGTVSELLADETWMRLTARCFRDMGLSLTIATGERMGGDSVGSAGDSEVQVQVSLSRLEADQARSVKLAKWIFSRYAEFCEPKLTKYPSPSVTYKLPFLTERQRMEGIVPLLQYGAMSIQTTMERSGLNPKEEFKRLKSEMPLRDSVIRPYASFSQISDGKESSAPVSQGRPAKPDLDPGNANTNRENARNGRDK